jgi:chromatin remodeling complex protein RSC6
MAKKAAAKKKTSSRKSAKSTRSSGARKTAARKGGRKTGARKAAGRKSSGRKPNAAFMAPVQPSDSLAEVVGAKPIPRTEVTKRLWAYIKKNQLQDPKNPRNIRADATLKPVFGGKSVVNMFEMTKLVNKQLG